MADSVINIIINTMKQGFGDRDTKSALKELSSGFQSVTGLSLSYAGALTATIAIGKKLFEEFGKEEEAANKAAEADARVKAILESTNDVSGASISSLDAYATKLSETIGVDDQLVKSGEAVLLTFTNINSSVFPKTISLAADMSTVIGGDLTGNINILGKAMNDFNGYTKLSRTIGSFSDDQKQAIQNFKDSNDLIGYQNYLLDILTTKYGGAAQAVADAGDGTEKLKAAQDRLNESMGVKFIPIAKTWNEFWLNWNSSLADNLTSTNNYETTIEDLGITLINTYNEAGLAIEKYYKNGVELSKDQVDAMINSANAADIASDRYDKMDGKIQKTTSDLEDETAAETKLNQQRLNDISKFETKLGQSVQDIQQSNHEIELSYIERDMMAESADGELTDAETAALEALGVQWGIYSANAIKEMKRVEAEAAIMAASIAAGFAQGTSSNAYGNPNNPNDVGGDGGSGTAASGSAGSWVYGDYGSGKHYRRNDGDGTYSYKASGGDVFAGMGYMVGEKGPEPFFPGMGGALLSNNKVARLQDLQNITNNHQGGSVTSIVNHFVISGVSDPNKVVDLVMKKIKLQLGGK